MLNPKDPRVLNGFIINTYDDVSQNVQIDVLIDKILLPAYACNYTCATCSATNKSDCYSCWSDIGLSYLMKYSNFGTCILKCPDGFTSNGDKTTRACVPCDMSCGTCADTGVVGDKNKCLTCAAGYNFRSTSDSKCLTSCNTNGYYQVDAKTCGSCAFPCKSCS